MQKALCVYIGSAHNWCDVKKLDISKNEDASFNVVGEVYVEFENEGVARNEIFKFETSIEFLKGPSLNSAATVLPCS